MPNRQNDFILYPDGRKIDRNMYILAMFDAAYFNTLHFLLYNSHLNGRLTLKESSENDDELF